MTTAARPTWDPAKGKAAASVSFQYSARDLASHTVLKYRHTGPVDPVKEELKQKLREAEQEHYLKLAQDPETPTTAVTEQDRDADLALDDSDRPSDQDSDSQQSEEEEEEEDDTQALLMELEKIKRERAEEKARLEKEQQAQQVSEMLKGNPLLNHPAATTSDFTVKRRWDEDVIFKNQARGVEDRPKKRFINDLLRSDFHRKFMNKYVR